MRKLLLLQLAHNINATSPSEIQSLPWERKQSDIRDLNLTMATFECVHHFEGLKVSQPLRKQAFKLKIIDKTSEVKFHPNFVRPVYLYEFLIRPVR